MKRREFLQTSVASAAALTTPCLSAQTSSAKLPDASYRKLPRWRGFNLLEKFNGRNDKFVEDHFRWISDWGFNFVRLPMDYRAWILNKDWKQINEEVLKDIDDTVKYGEKYGIHVNMNFHRAPGYTVARPAEPKSVWTDPEALDVCTQHWVAFAKRYKGIPNNLVSFNLFNEPASVEPIMKQCIAAHKYIISAIHTEDPNRLIICDGYEWGTKPFFDLADAKVAQATRGYTPSQVSHYKASWVNSEGFPVPTWPIVSGAGTLFSPTQSGIDKEFKGAPLVIIGKFSTETAVRFKVGTVSSDTTLTVSADGKTVLEKAFEPKDGKGEWEKSVYSEQWKIYQNFYNRDYTVNVPAGTKKVEIRVSKGQWLVITEIGVKGKNAASEAKVVMLNSWNAMPSAFEYDEGSSKLIGGNVQDKEWLRRGLEPWKELEKRDRGVMVGEFGAHSPCPHDVALRWMSDMLANWKEANWGFALWNLIGSFGILNSGRADVDYEDFNGRKLDRKMLKLLQEL
ncbi:MAG: glycoside hydrolase family 5 protein [Planctomycetaceae bacterium]|nr:glycoside hydrolase family 5 protein [Planctomycetaceae bacterium]